MRSRLFASAVTAVVLLPSSFAYAAGACTVPLTYSIGTVDSRFALSSSTYADAVARAAEVWNTTAGRTVFEQSPSKGQIRIDLLYDARQAETDRQKATIARLEKISAAFDSLFARHGSVASSTEMEQSGIATDVAKYKADENSFNADVAAANARGGASESEYRAFTERSAQLKVRFEQLKSRELAINERIVRLNALSDMLNQLVAAVNGYIARYNAELAVAHDYEEGRYEQMNAMRSITIYQFADETQLVRALTHELGHALGMDHVADTRAIMYRKNVGTTLVLSDADRGELSRVCGF